MALCVKGRLLHTLTRQHRQSALKPARLHVDAEAMSCCLETTPPGHPCATLVGAKPPAESHAIASVERKLHSRFDDTAPGTFCMHGSTSTPTVTPLFPSSMSGVAGAAWAPASPLTPCRPLQHMQHLGLPRLVLVPVLVSRRCWWHTQCLRSGLLAGGKG